MASEESTELDSVASEATLASDASVDSHASEPTDSDRDSGPARPVYTVLRRGCGGLLLLVMAAVVVLTAVLGTGSWVAEHATTAVPSVIGLRVPDATARLAEAELATATMGAFATTDFQSDVVMQQLPTPNSEVPLGAPVDLLVAVSPTPAVVPDVSLETTPAAESVLGRTLLRPVYYQQLSDTVPFGCVVSQMPRAGENVMTGQQVALFVSLGRGTGGAVVPSVLGKTVDEAATSISDAFLVAVLFDVRSTGPVGEKVTDQAPAPGTRVPIGSAVPLLTTRTVN